MMIRIIMHICIYIQNMWGFKSFNIRKLAHISSINLQVECAPLHCCARPRPAVCTGGTAKPKKGPQLSPITT